MIYVANTTKQDMDVHFRVIESTKLHFASIPSGSQKKLGDNWNNAQTENFIAQLEKYGAKNASMVSRNLEKFPGIFYRTDRPISESEIRGGHEAVVDHADKRAATELNRTALGADRAHRDKRTNKRLSKVTSVEVVQDTPRNQSGADSVHFSMEIAEGGNDSVDLG